MNRSIVICDDEPESLLHVTAHLKKFEQETGEKLDLLTFTSGEAMLADWPKKRTSSFSTSAWEGFRALRPPGSCAAVETR